MRLTNDEEHVAQEGCNSGAQGTKVGIDPIGVRTGRRGSRDDGTTSLIVVLFIVHVAARVGRTKGCAKIVAG